MRPAEGSIWNEDMPKTQKSNRGLERKYTSQLWKTKGGRRKGKKRKNVCDCRAPPLPTRPGHLDDAPLRRAATWLFPSCPHPVVQLTPHF